MGTLHAAKVAELAASSGEVELVGVADVDGDVARSLAEAHGCAAAVDFRELQGLADAAIVAVPTQSHFEVARELLAAGVDVLLEKPIAATLEEGEELIALATRGGRVLQVGHLEWFNTAMQAIRKRIDRPRFVEAHRMGPFPNRATDIDVVRDLMIHDLDILQQLLGEEPARIEAVGVPVLTPNVDIANARVTYPSGCVANLTASRVSSSPVRKLRFFQRDGYFSIDFLEQSAVVFRKRDGENGEASIEMEKVDVDRGDALLSQLEHFLRALRRRAAPHGDALGALRTALRVIEAMPSPEDLQ
jgi:predicted dehydrogenase